MRIFLTGAAALMVMATAAMADPAHGIWQTEVDDGSFAHVQLGPCANAAHVCGSIISAFRDGGTPYDSPNLGRQLVIDMVPQGTGDYRGSVWRPSNDRIYIGRMEVSEDRLALRGCVAGGLICARQDWVRVQ